MKITSVEPVLLSGSETYGARSGQEEATDQGDWLVLIRVGTDEGLVGWADVETLAPAALAVVRGATMAARGFRALESQFLGADPLDVEKLWDVAYVGAAYYARGGIGRHCLSAIDNCLWAIRAQAAGMSLASLLGGRRHESVLGYASTLFRTTPEENYRAAARYVARGFKAVKFGWGGFGWDKARDREA